ncbi:MAG: HEPN domain-containing protein [Armatimonadota bacterium]
MRSREQVVWDFVQQWIKKLRQTLKQREFLWMHWSMIILLAHFTAEQAAEKYLKVYLVRYQVEFRKTHD